MQSLLRDFLDSLYSLDREGSVMMKNIGAPDRMVRLGIGTLLVAISIYVAWQINPWLGLIPLIIGAFLVYEAALGWCALYALLGKNTCPISER